MIDPSAPDHAALFVVMTAGMVLVLAVCWAVEKWWMD